MRKAKELTAQQRESLLRTLQARFDAHMDRHRGIEWTSVQGRLDASPSQLWSLNEMERTGGEPDVIGLEKAGGAYLFVDCSVQSPKGRRSVCYDGAALEARKEHKPKDSAADMVARWGVELLTEEEYRSLQALGQFDTTTSSWVKTPTKIRQLAR